MNKARRVQYYLLKQIKYFSKEGENNSFRCSKFRNGEAEQITTELSGKDILGIVQAIHMIGVVR